MAADDSNAVTAVAKAASEAVRRGPVPLVLNGEESTPSAVHVARFIAAANGLDLRIVTVVGVEPVVSGVPGVAPSEQFATELARDQSQEAPRLVQPLSDEEFKLHVRFGSAVDEIASEAADIDASVIVLDASPRKRVRGTVSGRRGPGGRPGAQAHRSLSPPVHAEATKG